MEQVYWGNKSSEKEGHLQWSCPLLVIRKNEGLKHFCIGLSVSFSVAAIFYAWNISLNGLKTTHEVLFLADWTDAADTTFPLCAAELLFMTHQAFVASVQPPCLLSCPRCYEAAFWLGRDAALKGAIKPQSAVLTIIINCGRMLLWLVLLSVCETSGSASNAAQTWLVAEL